MEISPLTALNSSFASFRNPYSYDSGYRLMISAKSVPAVEPALEEAPFSPLAETNNFRIDDLLDFSVDDSEAGEAVEEDEDEEETGKADVGSSNKNDIDAQALPLRAIPAGARAPLQGGLLQPPNNDVSHGHANSMAITNLPQEPLYQHARVDSHGLCAPPDELADQLEWLSAFNEDSSYSGDRKLASLVSTGGLCSGLTEEGEGSSASAVAMASARDSFHTSSPVSVLDPNCGLSYTLPSAGGGYVPSRARSKRSRSHNRVWSSFDMLNIPTLLDNRLISGEGDSPVFVGARPNSYRVAADPPPPMKKSKKASPSSVAASAKSIAASEASQRRCSHCLVQKTPQWRAGPMGPKTLCNACGVRYKSGRLVPEYRPAGSPSFVNEVHSNSHKKILEMRRLKEVEEVPVYDTVKDAEDENDSDEEEEEDEGGLLRHGHSRDSGMKDSSFSGSNSCGSMASACVGSSNSGSAGDPSSFDSNAPLSKLSSAGCHGSCVERRASSSHGGISVFQESSFRPVASGAVEEDCSRQDESVGSF